MPTMLARRTFLQAVAGLPAVLAGVLFLPKPAPADPPRRIMQGISQWISPPDADFDLLADPPYGNFHEMLLNLEPDPDAPNRDA